ncbi:MAG: M2 family metallopeptidase [Gemmatimonadetes bacterium]|nr:M2 family metallopeptidase [Gemmatimonadota bacterium]
MRFIHHRFPLLIGLGVLALYRPIVLTAQEHEQAPQDHQPTVAGAMALVERAERELERLSARASRAAWVQSNFITHDTETMAAEASEAYTAAAVRFGKEAALFDEFDLPRDLRRKLTLLKLALTMPAPSDPDLTAETARLATTLEGMYGRGEYCAPDGTCLDIAELMRIMSDSRSADTLLVAWEGWRTIGPPMRDLYTRFVELMNQGARELGFADAGEMWRSNYDMDARSFAAEVDRLWEQVKPLYDGLHCYVRDKLQTVYGEEIVPSGKPIPAHLLGNLWAQDWSNVFDLVAPGDADAGYDLTRILREKETDAVEMVRYGERFFTSLGFATLPETFWERSLFTQPRDRDLVCHASAWDVDDSNDIRIKMCIEINATDFETIHHELGHNFYQRAYGGQPYLYRGSANDGFHEALGDAVALSVTPSYLVRVGLLDREPSSANDLAILLRSALSKIAFLPFGVVVDQWRWQVFSGEITPANYNTGWWALRQKYQGVAAPSAPSPRGEEYFDPGAKYHVPGNTPYARYFLAAILQFQFHRALCAVAGYEGPLHRCSIYQNAEAGRRLQAMMAMGLSRPWPDALHALTGQREMDATAIVDYYRPLKVWLDEENRGRSCGW